MLLYELDIIFRKWYRSIDKLSIFLFLLLSMIGIILVSSTSPVIAGKIGLPPNYFILRQAIYLAGSLLIILLFSTFSKKNIVRVSIIGVLLSIFLIILIKLFGYEVKGAKRWISIAGFSLQPTEFLKPFLNIIFAWLLTLKNGQEKIGLCILFIIYLIVSCLIITQPDLGMLVIITSSLVIELFCIGISYFLFLICCILVITLVIFSYLFLPHVKLRLNSYFFPVEHNNYQVSKSLSAFQQGGVFGKGIGQGEVKYILPDSHCDFIFAVAGEELGLFFCVIIIVIFMIFTLRFFYLSMKTNNKFIIISVIGLISQITLQSIINIGVCMNLFPTKGMTFPFISYGGSSSLGLAINLGFLLALSKRKITYE